MPDIVLSADTTRLTGSANSRRLRHTGRVPAVVYGHGIEAAPISVDARALRSALSTSAGRNAVFELDIDGTRHMAMAKMIDHHPIRHTIAHVDFLVVDRDEQVTADIPLVLIGEPEAVTRDGGVVEQLVHALGLTMLPGRIPDAIEIDVSDLQPGGSIRVADLVLPAGVATDLDPDTLVVLAGLSSVLPDVETAEGEEGADAAAGGS